MSVGDFTCHSGGPISSLFALILGRSWVDLVRMVLIDRLAFSGSAQMPARYLNMVMDRELVPAGFLFWSPRQWKGKAPKNLRPAPL